MDGRMLRQQLTALLRAKGAALVGVGSLEGIRLNAGKDRQLREAVEAEGMHIGVSVAVPVPAPIVETLKEAPTAAYYHAYYDLNRKLDDIVRTGERFLRKQGFRAFANTTDRVTKDGDSRTPLPHKTLAVRAGLGWIGKNCLLVTPEFGSAVRISSLLTDAPLPVSARITRSRCGRCRRCVELCPAKALKGALWQEGMDRSELFDWRICKKTQLARMIAATGIRQDLCGLCFAVCPFTQPYLDRMRAESGLRGKEQPE